MKSIRKSLYAITLEFHQHSREITNCAYLHSEGKPNKEIARILGISEVRVARGLQEATQKGIMEVVVYPPHEQDIARKLCETYGLREAYVYYIGIPEEVTNMLGKVSANYVERLLDDDKIKSVAIGPGETMLALANSISDIIRDDIHAASTAAAVYMESYMASNTIIGILAGKWRCDLKRMPKKISLNQLRKYSDIFIFGIDKITDMKGVAPKAIMGEYDIDESKMQEEMFRLGGIGGIAIINYQPIDREGKRLEWELESNNKSHKNARVEALIKPMVLHLDMIKTLAAGNEKKVICVAGGNDMVPPIKAALSGDYFNVLITDYDTAKGLL